VLSLSKHEQPNMNDMKTITVGERRFTYLEQGSGTPFVLLHGVGSAARSWTHQLEGLSRAFRVIAWDAPGYGGSSLTPEELPDAGDFAAALEDFLAALGVDRFHLVGHSFGCITAARFARLHPERILTLTLSGISGGHAHLPADERERLRKGRLDVLAELGPRGMAETRGPRLLGPDADEAARRAVIDTMAMVRPDGYTRAVHTISVADTRADVRQLDKAMRVQFIYGESDAITTPEQNRAVHRERPDAPVHALPRTGHAPYVEQPAAFNKILLEFAERHRDAAQCIKVS
jgi:pimeloyl-ACP methyl ester carboxylesterase